MRSPGPGSYAAKPFVGADAQGKTLSMKLCPGFEKYGANGFPGPGAYQTVSPNNDKKK